MLFLKITCRYYYIMPIAVMLVVLIGCVAKPIRTSSLHLLPRVQQVSAEEPLTFPFSNNLKAVLLKAAIVKLKRGENVGKLYAGPDCQKIADLSWRGRGVNFTSDELVAVFNEELSAAGHKTPDGGNDIFKQNVSGVDFLVGAAITSIDTNLCKPLALQNNESATKGSLYMKVNWEVYSSLERRVVGKFSTEGSYDLGSTIVQDSQILFENAFAIATRNLLANASYVALITGARQEDKDPVFDPIGIPPLALNTSRIKQRLQHIQSSTVTVILNNSHGSGFFISKSGYLLTNYHVVGNAEQVRIQLSTGGSYIGRVIRRHKAIDVALIKVDLSDNEVLPIPIQEKNIAVGSDVYAVGSPISEQFSGTISRGILSAYRRKKNGHYIQSDVMVHGGSSGGPLLDQNGNVIGITVAKALRQGEAVNGLNLFIPIGEALSALGIKLTNRPIVVTTKKAAPVQIKRTIPGQLLVKADPEDAKVDFVGADMVYFPGIQLKPGTYQVKISHNEYQDLIRTVDVKPGYNRLDVVMKRDQINCNICIGIPSCPYKDNGDGTVSDIRTNLMWMRCSLGQQWTGSTCINEAEEYNHPNSVYTRKYPTSNHAGYTDWRLPSLDELKSIIQASCQAPAVNRDVFPATPLGSYYSSEYGSCQFMPILDMTTGRAGTLYCKMPAYFRLVRSIH